MHLQPLLVSHSGRHLHFEYPYDIMISTRWCTCATQRHVNKPSNRVITSNNTQRWGGSLFKYFSSVLCLIATGHKFPQRRGYFVSMPTSRVIIGITPVYHDSNSMKSNYLKPRQPSISKLYGELAIDTGYEHTHAPNAFEYSTME